MRLRPAFLLLLLATWCALSIHRLAAWVNDDTLWNDEVTWAPANPRALLNLGTSLPDPLGPTAAGLYRQARYRAIARLSAPVGASMDRAAIVLADQYLATIADHTGHPDIADAYRQDGSRYANEEATERAKSAVIR